MNNNNFDHNRLKNLLKEFNVQHGEVFLNSVFGGGTYSFLLNLISKIPIIIIDTRKENYFSNAILYINNQRYEFIIADLEKFINEQDIKILNINHLIWSYDLAAIITNVRAIVNKLKLKLNIYIHDFYSICPTINLLDYKAEYCGLPDINSCNSCLRKYQISTRAIPFIQDEVKLTDSIHNGQMIRWRELWLPLFYQAEQIIFPSNSAADTWLKIYNEFEHKITIRHHDLDYLKNIMPHTQREPGPFFQIYIIGDIGLHKGGGIIHQLIEIIKNNKLNICINIIGRYINTEFENTPYLKLHGAFKHDEIPNILNSKKIDCFLMPSICPETFSYTTQEMMATGLPVISFGLGAQGAFISQYDNGIVVVKVDAKSLFNELKIKYDEYLYRRYPIIHKSDARDLKADLIKIVNETLNLQFEVEESEIYRTKLREEIIKITAESSKLKEELREIKIDLTNKNYIINNLVNSTSWQLTKSLRYTGLLLRKIKNIITP